MHAQLKQAIAAARTGNKKEAQVVLTQILEKDPRDVQAWYLLSLLVDSEEKQRAYLQKVIVLDPMHEKAQARLAELETAPPVAAYVDESSAFAEEEDTVPPPIVEMETTDTMPDWLFDEVAPSQQEPVIAQTAQDDLPDWLRDNEPLDLQHEETLAPAAEFPTLVSAPEPIAQLPATEAMGDAERPSAAPSTAPSAAPTAAPPHKQNRAVVDRQLTRLNQLLAFLMVCAAILAVLLFYFLFTGFFN